jgi:hypothetical protein
VISQPRKPSKGDARNQIHPCLVQAHLLTLMKLIFLLLLLHLATDRTNRAARQTPTRAQQRLLVVLLSPALCLSISEPSAFDLVSTHRGLFVSRSIVRELLQGPRRFVVGSQPQLLERLAATVTGW